MDSLIESLLWCIAQITLIGLLAWLLCIGVSRWIEPAGSIVPAAALAAVVVLTACAFLPWPQWWRFGPSWQADATIATREAAAHTDTVLADDAQDIVTSQAEAPFDPASVIPPQAVTSASILTGDVSEGPPTELAWKEQFLLWLPRLLLVGLSCGVVLGLLQLFCGLLSVRAYRRKSHRVHDAELLELVDCLRAEFSLTRKVDVCENTSLATAATIGWIRPVILLPPTWPQWTSDQRRAVLAHELAHVARGDYPACVLAQLSLAMHYYHPLVHWLAARLRLEQELAADAAAAAISGGRRTYLQSLAELALHTSERSLGWPAHTFLPTQGTFLRRIEMLRDSKIAAKPRPRWIQRWAAVGLLIIGAAAIAGLRGGPAASPFDTTANAQQPAVGGQESSKTSRVDLTYVNNDAQMLVAIRPTEVAKVPEIREVLDKTAGDGPSPVKLLTMDGLEQITLIGLSGVEPDDWGRDALALLQFDKAVTFEEIAKNTGLSPDTLRLPAAAISPDERRPAYGVVNDKTLVIGPSRMVGKYLANRRKGQPAIASGAAWEKVRMGAIVAALDMETIRDQFRKDRPGPGADEMIATLSPLWTDSEYVLAGVIVEGKTVHLRAVATCNDAELAGNVADTVTAATTLVRNMLRSVREKERDVPEFARFAMETGDGLLKAVKVERAESLVVVQTKTEMPKAGAAAAGGLIGAVTSARAAAQRSVSMNNMKQIMLAFHNYADTYGGKFPPPVIMGRDGKGKVPHSWRVEILPYIEQAELYKQYNFDEPWDSDANKKVLDKMPTVFRHPLDDPKSTSASYYVLTPEKLVEGKQAPGAFPTAFSAKEGMPFTDMVDGMSNTIALFEAKRDIPWTKPEDILFDKEKDLPKLGGYAKEGFNAGFCDGSVRFISNSIDAKTLKLLIMPGDGTPIPNF